MIWFVVVRLLVFLLFVKEFRIIEASSRFFAFFCEKIWIYKKFQFLIRFVKIMNKKLFLSKWRGEYWKPVHLLVTTCRHVCKLVTTCRYIDWRERERQRAIASELLIWCFWGALVPIFICFEKVQSDQAYWTPLVCTLIKVKQFAELKLIKLKQNMRFLEKKVS